MTGDLVRKFEEHLASVSLPEFLPELYDPIRYSLSLGGKRIRPVLLLHASELFGLNADEAMNQAAGVEMFHNFTLIHDDIMDNAPLRRGKPTVADKWNNNIAILSGDVLNSLAVLHISKCRAEYLPDVLSTFLEMSVKVCEGQQMDMNFETSTPGTGEYLEMIRLKTAWLIAGSMKIGAILAGAGKTEREEIFNYGMNIGIAFQIMDDFLDVFGSPDKFGKQHAGDIMAGKKTLLYHKCLEQLPERERSGFVNIYSERTTDHTKKIQAVKRIFETLGLERLIRDEVKSYLEKSETILGKLKGNSETKDELINLSRQLTIRQT